MIDWARVGELQDEIGADDFAEVVEMFLSEADEVAAQLKAGIPPEQVEAALHFLKGSALNLGFSALAAICQEGEKSAASGNAKAVDLPSVAASYDKSKQVFSAGLKARDAA
jgi:HPt (histidine-containing phosphotransfer) domain-containing protein